MNDVVLNKYQKLDLELMVEVIENHLDELIDFSNLILKVMVS